MAVKARFYVHSILKTNTDYSQVVLNAVTRKTDDNIDWSKYTPSGSMSMNVSNETGALAEFDAALDGREDFMLTLERVKREDA